MAAPRARRIPCIGVYVHRHAAYTGEGQRGLEPHASSDVPYDWRRQLQGQAAYPLTAWLEAVIGTTKFPRLRRDWAGGSDAGGRRDGPCTLRFGEFWLAVLRGGTSA